MKKPDWLKVQANTGEKNRQVMQLLHNLELHTVCEEAACPNCGECFGRRSAAFMILGRHCTRNCRFCNVTKAVPDSVDREEPKKLARAVKELGLSHVVITSVTRDDLADGGAEHFCRCIEEIRAVCGENIIIETLIPDFKGNKDALEKVAQARPDVLNHNIETVPRLYGDIRPMANYNRSLKVLSESKKINPSLVIKSGLMVGVGEMKSEIIEVMTDLLRHDCELLTIGQYLAPSKNHYPVVEYVDPQVFEEYKKIGLEMGFAHVAAGPLVRSSYYSDTAFQSYQKNK